jgi:chemotaxis protein methyltransferase CheR
MQAQLPALEAAALAEELTVGETYFFRHPDQFRAFTDVATQARLQLPSPHRPLRILSAGCASGEEAYSLAILLHQHLSDALKFGALITAIDVNPASIAKATNAQYSSWSLRGTPEDIRQRYFRGEKTITLDSSVRGLVSFELRNLVDANDGFWQPEQFDVIFCRNVVMYFTPEATRSVINRFTRSLVPGGYLFLGPAETLRGISPDYHLRHTHGTFYYQRRTPNERPTPLAWNHTSYPPVAAPEENVLPAGDVSWVSAISRAADRIAQLTRGTRVAANPLEDQPPASSASVTEPPRSRLQAARDMVREERFAEALAVLRTYRDAANDSDGQLLEAVILTNSGQPAEAEELCRRVLGGNELNPEAHYLLALCREHEKDFETAAEHDRTAIYLDQRFAMPHLHLGLLSKRLGDEAGLRREFRQARTLLPQEDTGRILLFGGGFSREMLMNLCDAELRAVGGDE